MAPNGTQHEHNTYIRGQSALSVPVGLSSTVSGFLMWFLLLLLLWQSSLSVAAVAFACFFALLLRHSSVCSPPAARAPEGVAVCCTGTAAAS